MAAENRRIVLAGGAGFLGCVLTEWFAHRGWDVVVLTRHPAADVSPARAVLWDGHTPGEWVRELEGASALVNLAGRSVNCRYTPRNRHEIMESRIASTRVLGAAIRSCREPPPVWLNSSTATIYKHSFDRAMDETSGVIGATPEAKDEFSVEVATSWEREFDNALTPQTRKVSMRTAIVFGAGPGSAFQILRRLSRLGLGGRQGTGRQFVSWIHEHDFASAVEWLISHEDLTGPVNLAAPNPLPNQEVMRILRKTCGAPIGLPAPEWLLEIGASFLRTETELVIKSRRVVPGKLLAAGFPFRITEFEAAVQELVTRGR